MTPRHYEALQALKQCTFLPGSFDKRFVRDLSALPADAELTERQAANVERLAYRYRRQIGRLIFESPTRIPSVQLERMTADRTVTLIEPGPAEQDTADQPKGNHDEPG